jgi:hypothetical protein
VSLRFIGAKREGQQGRVIVAHRGYRRDGFTPDRKKTFVAALAEVGTIADACRRAGISGTSFYRHEKKDPAFRSQCEAARAKASAHLDVLAWERGVTGIEEPLIAGGKVVGTRRRRSDSIFRLILQAADPDKYGHPMGGGAVLAAKLTARIERELRPRIEAELRAEGLGAKRPSRAGARALHREMEERFEEISRRLNGRSG